MNVKSSIALGLMLVTAIPISAGGKKKNQPERALVEKMEAVPCGAKQRGITGLGTIWASAGITSVNSSEKLCPQYTVVTDDMEYHIRPMDKHPIVLPISKEIQFKIKKDRMYVRVADADTKMTSYEVVVMKPTTPNSDAQNTSSNPSSRP